MLNSLKIENIAIIERAEICFGAGLNALTGETGAGKSIIIDSLNAVLGERTSRELIRTGAQKALVTAEFVSVSDQVIKEIENLGGDCPDGVCVLSRAIFEDGRNACRVNGIPVNVSTLKLFGSLLVNIHGQHDSQALLSPEKHCTFIDSAADNASLRESYKRVFSQLVSVKKELEHLYSDSEGKAARIEYLDYQIKELEDASLRSGEKDELNARKNICIHSKKVLQCFSDACICLSGDDSTPGAVDLLKSCAESLKTAVKYSEGKADSAYEKALNASSSADELQSELRGIVDAFDFSEEMLDEIDARLDLIFRVTSKYGGTEESALAALASMKEERSRIEFSDKRISELEKELEELSSKLISAAASLTESRKAAGASFAKRVSEELSFLDMPYVRFIVSITETSYSSKGADAVEFLLSPNPGEEPKPLYKIASGGELSRIMLAIKNVINSEDDIATLVFDEIDTGVSGRAASKIALKLREVSDGRQVICVTHLAQIAAQAAHHFKISKSSESGRTLTDVSLLDFEARKNELARIIGGLVTTEAQLQSAAELLENAGYNG